MKIDPKCRDQKCIFAKKTKMTQSQINEKSVKIYKIQPCLNT